ncbi:DUF4328 domain-containing protein [Streptomyces sp. NPDC002574]|uniref:DUF4328 domain-containing protein n=1 Tax=Streptomyces sp. NPDC002574 TaxID=3364652 RepID=UPI00369392B6
MSISPVGPPGGAAPYSQPGLTPTPPVLPRVLRSPGGLANAVTVLLALMMAFDLFSIASDVNLHSLAGTLTADGLVSISGDDADRAEVLVGVAALLQGLGFLATAVVFIIWFHRVRSNGEVFSPNGFNRGRGWAIGGWFIPFANIRIPYRIARDTWAASTQLAPDGSWRPLRTGIVTVWWIALLADRVATEVTSQMFTGAETPDALGDAAIGLSFSDALDILAAVLAIRFVRRLTAMQHIKAVQGPVAAF